MPLFIYPNLALYNHEVITVLWDLQICMCPTNGNATRVLYATSSSARASDMVMISAVILYHHETSYTDPTFDTLSSCVESPPPELEQSSTALTIPSYTRCESVLQMLLWSEGSPRPMYEGDLRSESSVTFGPHPQQLLPWFLRVFRSTFFRAMEYVLLTKGAFACDK
jgi:hypothetical protein